MNASRVRRPLPDAVRDFCRDDEWEAFQKWRSEAKPTIMLDENGRFPEVDHTLADQLFGRVVESLKAGQLVGFGLWGEERTLSPIESGLWSSLWYNIWFNELGYANEGRSGFRAIVVEPAAPSMRIEPKQHTRAAVKRAFAVWIRENPGTQIQKNALEAHIRVALAEAQPPHDLSTNLFGELWRTDFPHGNKFRGRPRDP